jgi:hypothetical protein
MKTQGDASASLSTGFPDRCVAHLSAYDLEIVLRLHDSGHDRHFCRIKNAHPLG